MTPKDLFEILVREHTPMLTLHVRCLIRDPGLADDVFQETLIVAWNKLDQYDRTRPFGPWLRGIAGKLALAAQRKQARYCYVCDEDILDHLETHQTAVSRQVGDTLDEKLSHLKDCLTQLPERYRVAVSGRYADEEQPLPDLAEQLELSLETLKKRLQRGRARLLDCLQSKLALAEVKT